MYETIQLPILFEISSSNKLYTNKHTKVLSRLPVAYVNIWCTTCHIWQPFFLGKHNMLMIVPKKDNKTAINIQVQIPVNSWEGSRILKWNLSSVTMSNVTSNSYLPLRNMNCCGITRLQEFKYLHILSLHIATLNSFCQLSLIPRPLLLTVLQCKTGSLWKQEPPPLGQPGTPLYSVRYLSSHQMVTCYCVHNNNYRRSENFRVKNNSCENFSCY